MFVPQLWDIFEYILNISVLVNTTGKKIKTIRSASEFEY